MGTERFLKIVDVQEALGVCRTTLWRWVNERGLKVVRVGGVTRIRESDLAAFLARHETSMERGGVENGETVERGS